MKEWLCCCFCEGMCVNIGSPFSGCSVCGESPLRWRFIFEGPTSDGGPLFDCCPALLIPSTVSTHALVTDLTGNPPSCQWLSGIDACATYGLTAQWVLTVNTQAIGGVTLKVIFSDGRVITWINERIWNCLCANHMIRDRTQDVGVVDTCGVPAAICVIPFQPCCDGRRPGHPLPRTIYASITQLGSGYAVSCPCIVGGPVIPMTWDPSLDQWVGTGPFGLCGVNVRFRLGCVDDITLSLPSGPNADVTFSGGSTCDGVVIPVNFSTIGTSAQWISTQCEPFHVAFHIQGPCVPGCAEVRVDIVEL